MRTFLSKSLILLLLFAVSGLPWQFAKAQENPAEKVREITPESEEALDRGLEWLAKNAGPEGNWESTELGLVSLGALAFMAAGHSPGRGRYGKVVERALKYVMDNSKTRGRVVLMNKTSPQHDMYNHGLATFVLGQAHGMTTSPDRRLTTTLDGSLKLICSTQCDDGGWDYQAHRQAQGHDLSLAVMQAKALRSAMDSGLEVPGDVVQGAVRYVRRCYVPEGGNRNLSEAEQQTKRGQFTYNGGGQGTLAMAACGVVCMQEFGEYQDWRIDKSMQVVGDAVKELNGIERRRDGTLPFDSYTLYYVGQACYQKGGPQWKESYPILRDFLVSTQVIDKSNPAIHGQWKEVSASKRGAVHRGGDEHRFWSTSIACFILAIPNRYLPILQQVEKRDTLDSKK